MTEQEIKDNDKYYRLDVRELVHIKQDLRKELISAKKEIELQVKEVELQIQTLDLKYIRLQTINHLCNICDDILEEMKNIKLCAMFAGVMQN